jgi:AraC family transcriptional regulator
MKLPSRSDAAGRLRRVEFLGVHLGLLGRIASERGVQVLATHGMPNGRTENRLTIDTITLVYTSRMPANAKVKRGRAPFLPLGSLCLATPGCPLKLRGDGSFTSSYCVLSPAFLASLSEKESGLRIAEFNLAAPIESARLTYIGQQILREVIAPGFAGALFAEAIGTAVVVEVARLAGSRGPREEPRPQSLAIRQHRQLESYVRAHLSDRLTLRELGLLIGVSVRRLSQAIKLSQGVSVPRWIAQHRVAEARRLLIETDLPVDEIGRRCAFQSAAAFSAAFRAVAGCAPGAFRRLTLD